MVARPLSLAVILTVAGLASSADTSRLTPSWNAGFISLKIPKNFPPNEPILTVALLYKDKRQNPQFNQDAERISKDLSGSTIGELRLPSDYDDAGMAMGPSGIPSGRVAMGGLPKLPSDEEMVLLSNPQNLFHPRLQDSSDALSLRLQRPLNLYDNVSNTESYCVEAIIGLNGTHLENKPTLGGCSRKKNGRAKQREGASEGKMLTVRIFVTEPINCERPLKHACLLPVEDINLRQWENRRPSPLLALPRVSLLCPNLRATYTLTMNDQDNGPQELVTRSNQLIITPSSPLDRERRDDVRFTVTCVLEGVDRVPALQTREGSINILDEDDAAPIRSRNPLVEWHLGNNTQDLDDQLMVLDPDLEGTNHYEVELLGQTYKLVTIESVNKFSAKKHLCIMETDNGTGFKFGADCTVMTPVLTFNSQNMGPNMPPKIYFSVVFIDKTLKSPISPIKRKLNRQVVYNVTLTLPKVHDSVDRPDYQQTNLWANIEYPTLKCVPKEELNITVTLPVGKFARLDQLISQVYAPPDLTLVPPPNAVFSIAPDSSAAGVGITPIMGILYVEDTEELRPGELKVMRGDEEVTTTINLWVESSGVACQNSAEVEMTSCAIHEYNSTCEQACGLGSAGPCSWRKYKVVPRPVSIHYATCSPDLDTCPDGICDELEMFHLGICQQDCVYQSRVKGQAHLIGKDGRGIHAALGVCSCTNIDTCTCFPLPSTPPETDEEPIKKPTHVWACDHWCKVGVSVGAVLFVALTLVCFVICRRRAGCGGKQKNGGISLGTFPSDERSSSLPYNRGDETHDSLVHGIGLRNSPRPEHNFVPPINLAIDSKWEFPRNRLVIEQTLGEGEFGKVMKARAQGINGTLGYTTVAVKMLKSNSTPAELADLLSEYTLLKEVSHPNVVRLLGACTSKGGPIYIIIEYCQYGSLRNYLKRSRHFEFESRVGSGPSDGTAGEYAITPKDLLSFAWQICKGMSYLTDMKLVHRDLAARNVLLAAGKQCKISDFGLTRDVYEGDLYFKRSKGRVPVKWMALESLVDHVYTSKSDVWGFGVLLWELVTLGTPPYPGITPERLFSLLKAGYRMEKPENCSQELYDVMLQCWAEDPNRRPAFKELTDIFDTMIQADVEYLELRSLIVTNRGYFDSLPPPPPPPGDDEEDDEDELDNDESPPPPQPQFLDAPAQFRDAPPPFRDAPPQFQDVSPSSSSQNDVTPPPVAPPPPQLRFEETRLQRPQSGWTRHPMDSDAYLVARTDIGRPRREESTEPLLAAITPPTAAHTPTITTTHAHNPAYSPTSETLPPPLHYSTLASRPDEEDAHTLECCRSEEDSDSGRATGDSGYATTEEGGRSRWRGEHKLAPGANGAGTNGSGGVGRPLSHHHHHGGSSPRASSYSPLPRHDPEYQEEEEEEQDTSEDLEERQELLTEDLIVGGGHLTPVPSPEPTADAAQSAAARNAAHSSQRSKHHHTTPIIV